MSETLYVCAKINRPPSVGVCMSTRSFPLAFAGERGACITLQKKHVCCKVKGRARAPFRIGKKSAYRIGACSCTYTTIFTYTTIYIYVCMHSFAGFIHLISTKNGVQCTLYIYIYSVYSHSYITYDTCMTAPNLVTCDHMCSGLCVCMEFTAFDVGAPGRIM